MHYVPDDAREDAAELNDARPLLFTRRVQVAAAEGRGAVLDSHRAVICPLPCTLLVSPPSAYWVHVTAPDEPTTVLPMPSSFGEWPTATTAHVVAVPKHGHRAGAIAMTLIGAIPLALGVTGLAAGTCKSSASGDNAGSEFCLYSAGGVFVGGILTLLGAAWIATTSPGGLVIDYP